MTNQEQFRESLIDFLRQDLVGPEQPQEVLVESPCRRYSAGILFPTRQTINESEDDRPEEIQGNADADSNAESLLKAEGSVADPRKTGGMEEQPDAVYDDTIAMANAFLPSAIGMSFIIDFPDNGIVIESQAAKYKSRVPPADPLNLCEWVRTPLELKTETIQFNKQIKVDTIERKLHDNLRLRVLYRTRTDDSLLVTVSMFNTEPRGGSTPPSATDCYFQTRFSVREATGRPIFREYRSAARSLSDPEEASLAILYRNRRSFAVGHGCAAEWEGEEGDRAALICTATVPSYTITPVEPRSKGGDELSMYFLSGADGSVEAKQIPPALSRLAQDYEEWIKDREGELPKLPARLRKRGSEHLTECKLCLSRIRDGIEVLRLNSSALRAFMLANRAMLMQQYHSRRRRRAFDEAWIDLPSNYKPTDDSVGRWRSFQLAFILMNVGSLLPAEERGDNERRDVVDLIWFPTGGGKTEAYLGLTAYTIFMRRLANPQNVGCTALMRYTLRLLTSQQFQRASSLMCACELIRQEMPDALGDQRVSIGLWVGQSLTPNTRDDAMQAVNKLAQQAQDADNPFQILTCPWCGTAMDEPRHLGYVVRNRTVNLRCPDRRCCFSKPDLPLPVLVVDEDIYDAPPSLIIGTVDKFAMLAWREQAGTIFGLGLANDPPDLIIQDELHLISGPLGSMVGLYETVIDLLCSSKGHRPKIVASTATIRRAEDQCKCLYDRKTFQFPPPGLDISDSFFAVENSNATGRKYVGVFAAGAASFVTALVRTTGALLQGCRSIPLAVGADEATRDPYWTLLQYFSSLRELGRAATLVEADIPEYMWAIASRSRIPKELVRYLGQPVELTSRRSAQEIPEILDRLKISYPRDKEAEGRPIDTLLATNMISVGVDIDRLGLMVVVGQPKTTSEYIQASSRVGRSTKAPGLVVAMYNPGKPRDRSHYEQFRAYHAAFYRYVEPTSVTPFSIPVLERALHALLVIVARHLCGVTEPNQWENGLEEIDKLTKFIEERSTRIDKEHVPEVMKRLKALQEGWAELLPSEWGGFQQPPPEMRPLMYPAGTEPRSEWDDLAWSTPSSLRNVDVECEARVLGLYPGPRLE